MGAAQSTSDDKVFQNEAPISFSQDVVNQLSDQLESPQTSSERQSTIDSLIRSKIKNELEYLKQEEEQVRQQIEFALEKENMDRESGPAKDPQRIPSSTELMGDVEEIRNKVDKYQARRDLADFPQVKSTSDLVVSCYGAHSSTPLECWKQVDNFKASVTQAEQRRLEAIH